jgi:hypothetical protein
MPGGRSVLKQRNEHRAGTFECLSPAYIRAEPSSSCQEARTIDPGEMIVLTDKTVAPQPESADNVVFAATVDGKWIRIEKDGNLVVKIVDTTKGATENEDSVVDDTASLGSGRSGSGVRSSIRSSIGGGSSRSPSPAGRQSIRSSIGGNGSQSKSSSPERRISGKFLPKTTAAQVEGERRKSQAISLEGIRRQSIGSNSSGDESDSNNTRRGSSSPTRRKSSISISEDSDGNLRLDNESRCKLVARLGESNYLDIKSEQIQNKLDTLSVLMQRQVQYSNENQKKSDRGIRFGDDVEY